MREPYSAFGSRSAFGRKKPKPPAPTPPPSEVLVEELVRSGANLRSEAVVLEKAVRTGDHETTHRVLGLMNDRARLAERAGDFAAAENVREGRVVLAKATGIPLAPDPAGLAPAAPEMRSLERRPAPPAAPVVPAGGRQDLARAGITGAAAPVVRSLERRPTPPAAPVVPAGGRQDLARAGITAAAAPVVRSLERRPTPPAAPVAPAGGRQDLARPALAAAATPAMRNFGRRPALGAAGSTVTVQAAAPPAGFTRQLRPAGSGRPSSGRGPARSGFGGAAPAAAASDGAAVPAVGTGLGNINGTARPGWVARAGNPAGANVTALAMTQPQGTNLPGYFPAPAGTDLRIAQNEATAQAAPAVSPTAGVPSRSQALVEELVRRGAVLASEAGVLEEAIRNGDRATVERILGQMEDRAAMAADIGDDQAADTIRAARVFLGELMGRLAPTGGPAAVTAAAESPVDRAASSPATVMPPLQGGGWNLAGGPAMSVQPGAFQWTPPIVPPPEPEVVPITPEEWYRIELEDIAIREVQGPGDNVARGQRAHGAYLRLLEAQAAAAPEGRPAPQPTPRPGFQTPMMVYPPQTFAEITPDHFARMLDAIGGPGVEPAYGNRTEWLVNALAAQFQVDPLDVALQAGLVSMPAAGSADAPVFAAPGGPLSADEFWTPVEGVPGALVPYLAPEERDPRATGWDPGAVGPIDFGTTIPLLEAAAARHDAGSPEWTKIQVWVAMLKAGNGPDAAQAQDILDQISSWTPYVAGLWVARDELRSQIDPATPGVYVTPSDQLSPLFASSNGVPGVNAPRSYYEDATRNGWTPSDTGTVNLDNLVPYLEYALRDSPGALRGPVEALLGEIREDGVTVREAYEMLRGFEERARVVGDQDPSAPFIADVIAGTLVAALGRATNGEFTRAVFAHNPAALEAFRRASFDTVTLNLLPYLEAGWRALFTDTTFEQALQQIYWYQDQLRAAHPAATLAGQVVGNAGAALYTSAFRVPFTRLGWRPVPAAAGGGAVSGAISGAAAGRDAQSRWSRAIGGAVLGGAWSGLARHYLNDPVTAYIAMRFGLGRRASEQLAGYGQRFVGRNLT